MPKDMEFTHKEAELYKFYADDLLKNAHTASKEQETKEVPQEPKEGEE
jgi:hypothetical protein